jgi:hypothetical protein
VSEENGAAIEEVSAAAEEMSAQVQEAGAAAQTLADLAESLKRMVAQFKLEGDEGSRGVGAGKAPAQAHSHPVEREMEVSTAIELSPFSTTAREARKNQRSRELRSHASMDQQ